MDRFTWSDGLLSPDEQLVVQQRSVKLYDGDAKTAYVNGTALLSTHRLLWRHATDHECVMSLPLSSIVLYEEDTAGFYKRAKILLHLDAATPANAVNAVAKSSASHIRLSFKEGGEKEFFRCLTETMQRKQWTIAQQPLQPKLPQAGAKNVRSGRHAGIVGIERNLQHKHKETNKHISASFEDLSQLMAKAKEMVTLSNNITSKLKEKQGDITEDETIRFKSYLLSLGISDPVTRGTHGTGNKYYKELAKQIATVLVEPVKNAGGVMTLTDIYCRINRARGMELLSPEDLLNACKLMESLGLPLRYCVFDSGVMVLQLDSHKEAQIVAETEKLVRDKGSLSADELSRHVGVSVVLAKERLLLAERSSRLCRDETVEGLRFYYNRFLLT